MPEENFVEKKEESISIQIFSVSATMVGVCLTILGLFVIFETLKKVETIISELITVNAGLFLVSCFLSYMAIRTKERMRRFGLERAADTVFLIAISLIVAVCILLGFELYKILI